MLPVYVTHARFLAERKPVLESQMRSIGLDFEWVFDFDPPDITREIEGRFFRPGNSLSPSQMSNALKHVIALQRVAKSGETSLILEDDIAFYPKARSALRQCLVELPHGEPAVAYVSCGSNRYTPARLLKKGQMLYPAGRSRTTDAYLITADAARTRLAWIDKFLIDAPTDHTFTRLDRETGIRVFWAEPPFAVQQTLTGTMRSAISPKRMGRSSLRVAAHFYGKRVARYYFDRWFKLR